MVAITHTFESLLQPSQLHGRIMRINATSPHMAAQPAHLASLSRGPWFDLALTLPIFPEGLVPAALQLILGVGQARIFKVESRFIHMHFCLRTSIGPTLQRAPVIFLDG